MKVQFDVHVLAKQVELAYAWCEIFDNAIAAQKDTKNCAILFEITEHGDEMTVSIKNNGKGVSKKKAKDMMNIGPKYEKSKTEKNENSVGMKSYIVSNNPSDDRWCIKSRCGEEIFKIVPPLMDWTFEKNFKEWDEGEYNFVVTTAVEGEKAKAFYRNITAEYISYEFAGMDHAGWRLVKNINGEKTDEFIPAVNIGLNPYIKHTTTDKETFETPTGKFHIRCDHFEVGANKPKVNGRGPTKKQTFKTLNVLEKNVPLFSIKNIEKCTYTELAGRSGNLAKNQNTQGIYLFVNGRFNGYYRFDAFTKYCKHNSLNGCISFVYIETEGTRFPADAHKRGFSTDNPDSELYVEAIAKHNEEWLCECKNRKTEKNLRVIFDFFALYFAKGLTHQGFNVRYDKERIINNRTNLIIDAGMLINEQIYCITEFKANVVTVNDAMQVIDYHRSVVQDAFGFAFDFTKHPENTRIFPNIQVVCPGAEMNNNAKEAFSRYQKEINAHYPGADYKLEISDINCIIDAMDYEF